MLSLCQVLKSFNQALKLVKLFKVTICKSFELVWNITVFSKNCKKNWLLLIKLFGHTEQQIGEQPRWSCHSTTPGSSCSSRPSGRPSRRQSRCCQSSFKLGRICHVGFKILASKNCPAIESRSSRWLLLLPPASSCCCRPFCRWPPTTSSPTPLTSSPVTTSSSCRSGPTSTSTRSGPTKLGLVSVPALTIQLSIFCLLCLDSRVANNPFFYCSPLQRINRVPFLISGSSQLVRNLTGRVFQQQHLSWPVALKVSTGNLFFRENWYLS